MTEQHHYRWALLGLIALNLFWVWLLPVLPAQDLPQHLAYARILMDHARADLPFAATYSLPEQFQPYYTVHYLLAALGRWTSLLTALRLLLSLYVIATFLSFDALVRALHPDRRSPPWTGLLGCLLIWNPVFTMGFLAFALCLPAFLWGTSALFQLSRESRPRDWAVLIASAVLLASVHVVAAGALALFALLFALFSNAPRSRLSALAVVGTLLITLLAWSVLGETGLEASQKADFAEALRKARGLEFLSLAFRVQWGDPLLRLTFVLWTALGPYRAGGLLLIGLAALALAFGARKLEPGLGTKREFQRPVLAFAAAAWVLPFGVDVPTELTFLNFRMMTLALGPLLALAAPARFSTPRLRLALGTFCTLVGVHFGYRALGFASEARPLLALLEKAEPRGMLAPLSLHERSDHFAKQFHLTHFLPMYYTAFQGGLCTQFWARYTNHLPVGYQPGKDPSGPLDLAPQLVEAKHLERADWFLLELAREDDPKDRQAASARALALFQEEGTPVRCHEAWCLFRSKRQE